MEAAQPHSIGDNNHTQGEVVKIHPHSEGDRTRVIDFCVANGCTIHDEGHGGGCVCVELGGETTLPELLDGMNKEHIKFQLDPDDCETPVKQESFSLLRDLLKL